MKTERKGPGMQKTAHSESLTDIAERKIFDYLRENHFRPGDRLPMEEEFADMFQTSPDGRRVRRYVPDQPHDHP